MWCVYCLEALVIKLVIQEACGSLPPCSPALQKGFQTSILGVLYRPFGDGTGRWFNQYVDQGPLLSTNQSGHLCLGSEPTLSQKVLRTFLSGAVGGFPKHA